MTHGADAVESRPVSFTPNAGTVVRLDDGRVRAVTRFTSSGDDDRVVFAEGHEERLVWEIAELLTDEDSVGSDPQRESAASLAVSEMS
jgi:hypothetical protein